MGPGNQNPEFSSDVLELFVYDVMRDRNRSVTELHDSRYLSPQLSHSSSNVTMRFHPALVISAAFFYTTKALLNPDSIQGPSQRYRYVLAPTKRRSTSFHLDETRLVRNETGGANPAWISSQPLSFLSESLEQIHPPVALPTHNVSASIQNAIKQVHAIFDLYNTTTTSSPTSTAESLLSPDLALMTLQGVVFQSVDSMYKDPDFCNVGKDGKGESCVIMEQLHALVWRLVEDLCLVPPRPVLETLCCIHQQRASWTSQQPALGDTAQNIQAVSRTARLLSAWYEWSRGSDQFGLSSPQSNCTLYLIQLLEFVVQHQVPMSLDLWELYCTAHQQQRQQSPPPRKVYSHVLATLALHSTTEWKVRQTRILQDMVHLLLHQPPGNAYYRYQPTAKELLQALEAAAENGRVQDAAWLLRQLQLVKGVDTELVQTRFFQALFYATEPGALTYMERLFALPNDGWQSVDRGKLLLRKFAFQETPGSGKRAQACFQLMKAQLDDWRPDGEAVHLVVAAHLKEENMTLSNVLDADSFVRRCVRECCLRGCGGDSLDSQKTTDNPSYPWPVFDTLLEAYVSCGDATAADALLAADSLFQLFLVQHRNGNVAEEPHNGHLKNILLKWKHHPNATGVQTSLESVRLVQDLGRRGLIHSNLSVGNIREVLGILARSKVKGWGSASRELLQCALNGNAKTLTSLQTGYMFGCAIQCCVSEQSLDGLRCAISMLDELEQALDRESRLAPRLKAFSYSTILRALTILGDDSKAVLESDDAIEIFQERCKIELAKGDRGC
jgi:hypothetical protein